jgi:hypothetical protein
MNGTTLVKYTGSAKEVTIPSNVTAIGNSAFNQTAITYVQIPSSVTSIGDGAFSTCWDLTVVAISEGVKTIGVLAFSSTGLTRVNIPSSITSIDSNAFANCPNLYSVSFSLPSSVTKIEISTFNRCTALRDFKIPQGVTEIGEYAFLDTLINEITIPASVKSIGRAAFYSYRGGDSNTKLAKITFEGIPSINFQENLGLHLLRLGGGIETYTRTRNAAGEWTEWTKQTQTPAVPIQEPVQQPVQPGQMPAAPPPVVPGGRPPPGR